MGMNTKPSLRTGFAGVSAHAVAAGIIASSNGSESAAPALLSNFRRGIAFFVRNIALTLSLLLDTRYFTGWGGFLRFTAPHLKRSAFHDPENKRREAVSVLLGVIHDLANGRRIVVLNASAERERQKVFR
jgi:hypothetical protein